VFVRVNDSLLPLAKRTDPAATVTSTAVNGLEQEFATTLQGRTARIWDVTDALDPKLVHTFDFRVLSLAIDPAGARTLVTVSEAGDVALWDWPGRDRPVRRTSLNAHPSTVDGVDYSPDGQIVVTHDDAGTLRLWDVTDPERPIGALATGRDITAVALSPDNLTLAVGFAGGLVRMWDLTKPLASEGTWTQKVHPESVRALGFRQDGRALAIAGKDDTVSLWDVSDRAHPVEQGRISHRTDGIYRIAFGDSPTEVITAKSDGTTRAWQFDFDTAVAEMCSAVEVHISREEWQQYVGALDYFRPCA
jgi:WD40 repeat protein